MLRSSIRDTDGADANAATTRTTQNESAIVAAMNGRIRSRDAARRSSAANGAIPRYRSSSATWYANQRATVATV